LNVEFEHEPVAEMIEGTESCVNEPGNIDLPDSLRERLLSAARINALTEIETLIAELKGLGPDAQCLTDELDNLLERYDMDGIILLINQVSNRTE
jgi:hypothetical protein